MQTPNILDVYVDGETKILKEIVISLIREDPTQIWICNILSEADVVLIHLDRRDYQTLSWEQWFQYAEICAPQALILVLSDEMPRAVDLCGGRVCWNRPDTFQVASILDEFRNTYMGTLRFASELQRRCKQNGVMIAVPH
ncbi:MAG: hypothetical protein WCV79_01230 [Candidatus Paceibacterota bacterium]|jgi:hypothetical protein